MPETENDFSTFGDLLKHFRKQHRLTQQALADLLRLHRMTISRWEQGDYLPESKTQVLELTRALRLSDQETRQLLEASLTALSPYFLVPLPRNPYFTGREVVLSQLEKQLRADQPMALTQSSALHGLGGVGKTQIALEYAYRHALQYSAVFWIAAETQESIVAGLLQIAEMLKLPERENKDQQHVVVAVQRWLSTHGQWLLIWDNVEDLDILSHFLPATRSGAILITTRCQTLGTLAHSLDLLPMEQEEGICFLLQRAKMLGLEATSEQIQQLAARQPDEYAAAWELVTILGGLPLALDQAGAYIEETVCGLSGYLRRYQQYCTRLLEHRGRGCAEHPHSVKTTFRLLYERIEREQQAAADVLRVCAFLYTEAIPEEVFVEGAAHLGPHLAGLTTDPVQFDQVLAVLLNLSLVRRHPETRTFSMHRLVQVVLREGLETGVAHQWRERAIQAVNAAFPEPEFVNWSRCERYIAHAQVSLQYVEQCGNGLPEARALFLKTGRYLLERGRYTEAERFLVQACGLGQQQHGEHDLEMARTLDRLATVYWRQERYHQAEPLFQRSLTICEHCLGPSHPETAHCLNNLALLYYQQGDYQQAERVQHRALTISEDSLAPMHPDLALQYDNMARIWQAQGKYPQAEQLYKRALAIWDRQPGPAHPSMTFCLNNLGCFYLEQGAYKLAEPLFQRALAMRQQSLGPDHPRTATSLLNLARLFLKQERYEEAMQLLQRALLILEQQTGSEGFYLARVLETIGIFYQVQGNDEQAETSFMRALTIQEQHLGAEHPETLQTLHDLAILRQKQGNVNEAVSLAERVLSIRSQSLGDAHPKTVATRTLSTQLAQEQASAQKREDPRADKALHPLHKVINPSSSENDPLQEFLDARCALHPRAWCRSADLWQTYERWVQEHQEDFPLSRGAFIAQLKAHGCRADRTMTARIWRGIALVKKEA